MKPDIGSVYEVQVGLRGDLSRQLRAVAFHRDGRVEFVCDDDGSVFLAQPWQILRLVEHRPRDLSRVTLELIEQHGPVSVRRLQRLLTGSEDPKAPERKLVVTAIDGHRARGRLVSTTGDRGELLWRRARITDATDRIEALAKSPPRGRGRAAKRTTGARRTA